jgi:glutamine synthetase
MCRQDKRIIKKISYHIDFIIEKTTEMIEARAKANVIESERSKAIAYHDTVVPLIEAIRFHIDELELIVDDRLWTLPKYRELLFVR